MSPARGDSDRYRLSIANEALSGVRSSQSTASVDTLLVRRRLDAVVVAVEFDKDRDRHDGSAEKTVDRIVRLFFTVRTLADGRMDICFIMGMMRLLYPVEMPGISSAS